MYNFYTNKKDITAWLNTQGVKDFELLEDLKCGFVANYLKEFIEVAEIEINKWERKYYLIMESLEGVEDDK